MRVNLKFFRNAVRDPRASARIESFGAVKYGPRAAPGTSVSSGIRGFETCSEFDRADTESSLFSFGERGGDVAWVGRKDRAALIRELLRNCTDFLSTFECIPLLQWRILYKCVRYCCSASSIGPRVE